MLNEVLNQHIIAIRIAIKKLSMGKFWLFLLPSLLISLLFYFLNPSIFDSEVLTYKNNVENATFIEKIALKFDVIVLLILKEFHKFFVLTLLSPVYCLLSEKVDEELTGKKVNFELVQFILDALRAFLNVLIAFMLNMFYFGIWFFISFIFGLKELDTYIYFLISTYFVGFAFFDYSLERYRVNVFSSWRYIKSNRISVMITGVLFYVLYYVPIFGLFLAPFVLTITSTIVYLLNTEKLKV